MKRLHYFCIIGFCSLVAVASVEAGTIFEQGTGPSANFSSISSTLNNSGSTPGYLSADNFAFTTNEIVTDVHWWGYSNEGGNDFQFTFYEDISGLPGDPLLSTGGSLSTANAFAWGFDDVLLYSSFLDTPFNALANTPYWLSIFNSAADASWLWLGAYPESGTSFQREFPGVNWWQPSDLAFRLTDDAAPIPEPATMLLLGTGLVGVAGATRRKKKNQA